MRTLLFAVGFTFGTVSASLAASPTVPPTVMKNATSASGHKYWLSEGLNRLVFWQPPGQVRGERSVRD